MVDVSVSEFGDVFGRWKHFHDWEYQHVLVATTLLLLLLLPPPFLFLLL